MSYANPNFLYLHTRLRESLATTESDRPWVCFTGSLLLKSVGPKYSIDLSSIGADAIDPDTASFRTSPNTPIDRWKATYREIWLRFYPLKNGELHVASSDLDFPKELEYINPADYTLVSPLEAEPYIIQYNRLAHGINEGSHPLSPDEAQAFGRIVSNLTVTF